MIKIIVLACLVFTSEGFLQKNKTIPQGNFKYELYFAEFSGRMENSSCNVEIKDNKIKILQDESTNFSGGELIFKGVLVKHNSGAWILANEESDKNAERVGGCTAFPIIYFECNLIEWC